MVPPGLGQVLWAKEQVSFYCSRFRCSALVTCNENKRTALSQFDNAQQNLTYFSNLSIAGEGIMRPKVNPVNTNRPKPLQRSYCPILFARFSAPINERRNWLDLIVAAELCEEMVKAERIASLTKSAI